jgi:hypothetical protein
VCTWPSVKPGATLKVGTARFTIDGISPPTTTVLRSDREMRALVETWKITMMEKGWI